MFLFKLFLFCFTGLVERRNSNAKTLASIPWRNKVRNRFLLSGGMESRKHCTQRKKTKKMGRAVLYLLAFPGESSPARIFRALHWDKKVTELHFGHHSYRAEPARCATCRGERRQLLHVGESLSGVLRVGESGDCCYV